MSDFWKLWNVAETGDTEAAHRVNVLVAKQAGYSVQLEERPMYSKKTGELLDVMKCYSLHTPAGKNLSQHGWNTEESAWDDVPDYMNNLNAAHQLPLPDNCYIVVQTPIAPRKSYDVRAYLWDEYGTGRGIAIAHSTKLASAWVAVWLQVMAGKIAG